MARRDQKQPQEPHFDAVAAATELEESLGQQDEPGESGESEGGRPPRDAHEGAAYAELLEADVEALSEMVEQRERALALATAAADQARAEVSAAGARLAREAQRDIDRRERELLLLFLEVFDDLDRALAAGRKVEHNPAVLEGLELVRNKFLSVLGKRGATHRPALGEPFDPAWHEAVGTAPGRTGVVVHVLREGFAMAGEPLRAAQVLVGAA